MGSDEVLSILIRVVALGGSMPLTTDKLWSEFQEALGYAAAEDALHAMYEYDRVMSYLWGIGGGETCHWESTTETAAVLAGGWPEFQRCLGVLVEVSESPDALSFYDEVGII